MSTKRTGKVKFFLESNGYGFITPDDGGEDVFIHIKSVRQSGLKEVKEGDVVEFEMEFNTQKNKSHAVNIRKIGAA